MNQNYYPVDFEAQYEDTSEKMIEIASKFKDRIRSAKPAAVEELEGQLEDLQLRIDDRELQFRKEPIYSQFAAGQQMAERRRQPPEMCPECGEELKKQAQCEFCAEIFCVKCCCRKRAIPFLSKEIRLCCEQCHWKFVKLFDNRAFYEEKEKLANVIHFVKNKVAKISEKIAARSAEVEEFKRAKRDEKIKEKAVEGRIAQEERKLRQAEEELRRVVGEKAERMREEERRRQREEEEREKARRAELERDRLEEQERLMQLERARRQRELEEQEDLSASQKKIQAEAQERNLVETFRRKEEELRRREEELLRKEQEIKRQLEAEERSAHSSTSIDKQQTPKQSIGNTSSDREKYVDTADSNSPTRSRRQSGQNGKEEPLPPKTAENLVRTESTKSGAEQPLLKKVDSVEKEAGPRAAEEQPVDSLERSLVNMFKPKKEDDSRSMVSNVSKTSKSILDMSINELLAVRIPVARTASKIEEEERPAPVLAAVVEEPRALEEERRVGTAAGMVAGTAAGAERRSVKVEEVEEVNEEEVRMNKESILQRSSLISSNKQTTAHEEEVAPQKCACEIM